MKTDREDKIERARVLVVEAKRTEPWTMGRSAVAAELLGMLPELLDAIGEARARAEAAEADRQTGIASLGGMSAAGAALQLRERAERAEAQRDEALAKLAELREECVHSFDDDAGGGCRVESFACLVCGGDGETRADVTHAEGCAVAATPADLAAERDRRVRDAERERFSPAGRPVPARSPVGLLERFRCAAEAASSLPLCSAEGAVAAAEALKMAPALIAHVENTEDDVRRLTKALEASDRSLEEARAREDDMMGVIRSLRDGPDSLRKEYERIDAERAGLAGRLEEAERDAEALRAAARSAAEGRTNAWIERDEARGVAAALRADLERANASREGLLRILKVAREDRDRARDDLASIAAKALDLYAEVLERIERPAPERVLASLVEGTRAEVAEVRRLLEDRADGLEERDRARRAHAVLAERAQEFRAAVARAGSLHPLDVRVREATERLDEALSHTLEGVAGLGRREEGRDG